MKVTSPSQSNAEAIASARKRNRELSNVPRATELLVKSGVSLADLDALPIVHVSGTKGKGSTCAFLESILRHRGLRTGFFSSPHLVNATERIRLNGQPVSQELFTSHFWRIYDKLREDSPQYFQFLTILAINVFCVQRVDVAIMEVGIGGEYDTTNVIRRPRVCGITSLGIDHTELLGDTIEYIAWHKAGIMKKGVTTVVASCQEPGALDIILDRSKTIGSSVTVAPALEDYGWGNFPPCILGLKGPMQRRNASLALQLGRKFIQDKDSKTEWQTGTPFDLDLEEALGLRLCSWPGRAQTLRLSDNAVLLLDGAHTRESMLECVNWYKTASKELEGADQEAAFKVLLFNATGERRRAECMLEPLSHLDFDLALFCTNVSRLPKGAVSDNTNRTVTFEAISARCAENRARWDSLCDVKSAQVTYLNDALAAALGNKFDALPNDSSKEESVEIPKNRPVQVLVTGSLYLVGGVLKLVKPDVCRVSNEERRRQEQVVTEYSNLG